MLGINWKKQYENFGLEYPNLIGDFFNYKFFIKYDYDGKPSLKPNCGLILTITKNNVKVLDKFGYTEDELIICSNKYLEEERNKFY